MSALGLYLHNICLRRQGVLNMPSMLCISVTFVFFSRLAVTTFSLYSFSHVDPPQTASLSTPFSFLSCKSLNNLQRWAPQPSTSIDWHAWNISSHSDVLINGCGAERHCSSTNTSRWGYSEELPCSCKPGYPCRCSSDVCASQPTH